MLNKEEISIIVVDDLQFSCEVVKSGLKKSGYKDIRTANSANQAMLLQNQKRADVILADFWMPDVNGLELTALIRRWDENNNRYTGIILLTAEDAISSIVTAFEQGVDDFVAKSANHIELAARVYGAGRTAHLQNGLRKLNSDLTFQYENFNQRSLVDTQTGLPNARQFKRTLEAMINHCDSRGGGVAVGMFRFAVDDDTSAQLRSGTLRVISSSLAMVVRPLDEVARLDNFTFVISFMYMDQGENFVRKLLARSISSIQNHTHLTSDKGQRLKLYFSSSNIDSFKPAPNVENVLEQLENELQLIDSYHRPVKK